MKKPVDILVIDDEQVVNDAVTRICSSNGFTVESALDISIAFSKLQQTVFRVILCDIMMPDGDGFHFLSEMRERQIDVPVIMTTGYSTLDNAVDSLYKGAIDFVPKPFTADELLSSISRGMKYADIQRAMKHIARKAEDMALMYVPCPATYYRLGYIAWLSLEDSGVVAVGVTDLLLKTLGVVETIEIQKTNHEVEQGSVCALIHSENSAVHPILSPISGRIIEANEDVSAHAAILEKDPYFKGWIYRVIPSDLDYELKHLMPCSSDRL
jgi:FixJ family two-component response regulator/glycine cleavage system H lipoate-binding protein